MTKIKAIIFDLGGVLIDFSGMTDIRSMMRKDPGLDAIRPRWITCPTISAFERGEISSDIFASEFTQTWDLQIEPDDFISVFKSWIKGTLPGTEQLLVSLRPHYTLACLSNTNPLHWSQMMHDIGLYSQLDQHFASHTLGRMKPDPNVFADVCAEMGFAPSEVVFFDDGVENIEGAKQAGLSAYQVQSPGDITMKLKALGLMSRS
jgi:glucose-1-phosphatase